MKRDKDFIPLVRDTIDKSDIKNLIKWLKTNPQLTKGSLTEEFEDKWAKFVGTKYSVFLNSGSSANLAIAYFIKYHMSCGMKDNDRKWKIVIPSISWVTTLSPWIQFGIQPILCDANEKDLSINLDDFENICKNEKPKFLMLVHVLGIPADMEEVLKICEKYNVILLEDCCEAIGSEYKGKKVGTFGLASSFSTYYSHVFSTIEGGFVNTDDKELYNFVKSIRAHGWSRDLLKEEKNRLKEKYDIDEFQDLYTFYYPGFNLRNTDLHAFLGIEQLKKLDMMRIKRNNNLKLYDELIKNNYWKLDINNFDKFISNLAYPIITKSPELLNKLVNKLQEEKIDTRPLVAGNVGLQPFWYEYNNGNWTHFDFADKVHYQGCYIPNNHLLKEKEIKEICNIINSVINERS